MQIYLSLEIKIPKIIPDTNLMITWINVSLIDCICMVEAFEVDICFVRMSGIL